MEGGEGETKKKDKKNECKLRKRSLNEEVQKNGYSIY